MGTRTHSPRPAERRFPARVRVATNFLPRYQRLRTNFFTIGKSRGPKTDAAVAASLFSRPRCWVRPERANSKGHHAAERKSRAASRARVVVVRRTRRGFARQRPAGGRFASLRTSASRVGGPARRQRCGPAIQRRRRYLLAN